MAASHRVSAHRSVDPPSAAPHHGSRPSAEQQEIRLSDQSKFRNEEIERQRRAAISKRKNVDYDKLQAQRDILLAARSDSPEEFQAHFAKWEIDLNSEQGRKVMEAYWAIRRERGR
jgi:hypothetical protein